MRRPGIATIASIDLLASLAPIASHASVFVIQNR